MVLLFAAVRAVAATPFEFYQNLLRRGVADFNSGRLEPAVRELNIAAFGLLDAVDQFQMAQTYIAIASDRLGREADARRAAQRVIASERVNARFASISLPGDIRSAFAGVTRKLLTSDELAVLGLPARPPVVPVPPRLATGDSASPQPQASAATPEAVPQPQQIAPPPVVALPDPPPQQPAQTTTPAPATRPAQPTTNEPAPSRSTNAPATTNGSRPEPRVTPRSTPPVDVRAQLDAAERALSQNELGAARTIYGQLLNVQTLDHATLLRIAEGSYRSRDFRGAVEAFERAGTLRAGEELYGYYLAVALYETGRYPDARRALDAALPFIEETPAVARYRAKIESALE